MSVKSLQGRRTTYAILEWSWWKSKYKIRL